MHMNIARKIIKICSITLASELSCRCSYCTYVNVIEKFSQYELQYGDAEIIFESAQRNYPKWSDVCSVYTDLLFKQEDFNQVRYSKSLHQCTVIYA